MVSGVFESRNNQIVIVLLLVTVLCYCYLLATWTKSGNLITAKRRLLFDASRLFLVIPKGVLDKTFVC